MRYIFLVMLFSIEIFAMIIETPVVSIDRGNNLVKVKIANIDIGMSGFITHKLGDSHESVLKGVTVVNYNQNKHIATLKMSKYSGIAKNSALPNGLWKVQVGDIVVLAFGYSRALLIAPNEEIYYKVSRGVKIQWIHPDLFATLLSFNGHPTPLKEDFEDMSDTTAVGLIFFFIDEKLFMLDAKSFKILGITEAPFVTKSVKLPFYTRVKNINANWWGAGSSRLKSYAPYYYSLLIKYNRNDKKLYHIIENDDKKYHYLLNKFKLEDK